MAVSVVWRDVNIGPRDAVSLNAAGTAAQRRYYYSHFIAIIVFPGGTACTFRRTVDVWMVWFSKMSTAWRLFCAFNFRCRTQIAGLPQLRQCGLRNR